jgi:hypothetical protein
MGGYHATLEFLDLIRVDESFRALGQYRYHWIEAIRRWGGKTAEDGVEWVEFWTHQDTWAELCFATERTIRRAIVQAQESGFATVVHQYRGGKRTASRYRITVCKQQDSSVRIELPSTSNQPNQPTVRSTSYSSPGTKPSGSEGFVFGVSENLGHSTQSQSSNELELTRESRNRTEVSGWSEDAAWHEEWERRRKQDAHLASLPPGERAAHERKEAQLAQQLQEIVDREREEYGDDDDEDAGS